MWNDFASALWDKFQIRSPFSHSATALLLKVFHVAFLLDVGVGVKWCGSQVGVGPDRNSMLKVPKRRLGLMTTRSNLGPKTEEIQEAGFLRGGRFVEFVRSCLHPRESSLVPKLPGS